MFSYSQMERAFMLIIKSYLTYRGDRMNEENLNTLFLPPGWKYFARQIPNAFKTFFHRSVYIFWENSSVGESFAKHLGARGVGNLLKEIVLFVRGFSSAG